MYGFPLDRLRTVQVRAQFHRALLGAGGLERAIRRGQGVREDVLARDLKAHDVLARLEMLLRLRHVKHKGVLHAGRELLLADHLVAGIELERAGLGRLLVRPGEGDQRLESQDRGLGRAEAAVAATLLADPLDSLLNWSIEVARAIGLEPAEHGQSSGLDLQVATAGAGDARLRGIEVSVFLLGCDDRFQQGHAVAGSGPVDEAVGDQSDEVRVFRRLRLASQRCQFLLNIVVLAALGQRPDYVGVGDIVGSAAEGVDRARIALEAALAVLARHQVIARALDHLHVHVVHAGHVAELEQPVRREGFVRRSLAAEPFVAAPPRILRILTFERHQPLVAAGQQFGGSLLQCRIGLVALLQVIENEHVGIVAARRLLEAAARLTKQRFQPLLQVGQGRGEHLQPASERSLDPGLGQHHLLLGGAFQNITARIDDGETVRYDRQRSCNAILVRCGRSFDGHTSLAINQVRLEPEHAPRAAVWTQHELSVGVADKLQAGRGNVHLDRALFVGVVGDADRHVNLVAGGHLDRQLGLEREQIAGLDDVVERPDAAVQRMAEDGRFVAGHRIRQTEGCLSPTARQHEYRVPVDGVCKHRPFRRRPPGPVEREFADDERRRRRLNDWHETGGRGTKTAPAHPSAAESGRSLHPQVWNTLAVFPRFFSECGSCP